MGDTEDCLSLVQALRNFGDAAYQLAASWERHHRAPDSPLPTTQDASTQVDLVSPHGSPSLEREPPVEDTRAAIVDTQNMDSVLQQQHDVSTDVTAQIVDTQNMDSVLQQQHDVSTDVTAQTQSHNAASGAIIPRHEGKLCLRCFRSWKRYIQAGEDVRPCIFQERRGTIKCRYCSVGRAQCIILPRNLSEPLLRQKLELDATSADDPQKSAASERLREIYAETWKAVRRTPSLQRTGRWLGRE